MHYFAIVVVPANTDDIQAEVDRILAPYDEQWGANDDGWWDWQGIGGRWNGVLVGDKDRDIDYGPLDGNVVPIRDLSERTFYRIVLPDGRTEAKEIVNPEWDGKDYSAYSVPNPAFTEMVGRDLVAYRDHLAVAVDYHS